jgi:hypothetical protein
MAMTLQVTTFQAAGGGWCWSYNGVKNGVAISADCGDEHCETTEEALVAARDHALAAEVQSEPQTVVLYFDDEGNELQEPEAE